MVQLWDMAIPSIICNSHLNVSLSMNPDDQVENVNELIEVILRNAIGSKSPLGNCNTCFLNWSACAVSISFVIALVTPA
jgi:hypothetical protein